MQFCLRIFLLFFCATSLAMAAAKTETHLILSAETARPGETIWAGIQMQMPPGWHTYWKNSGESGGPTEIKWEFSNGISAGEIQWQLPEKLSLGGLTTYVYQNEVVLLVPLQLAKDLTSGTLEIKAAVSWLECAELCIPGKADVKTTLTIGAESKPSTNSALLETWQKKLPQKEPDLSARSFWEKKAEGDLRPLILEWNSSSAEADFFPYSSEKFEVQPATENLSQDKKIQLRKLVKKSEGDWPKQISGVLIEKGGEGKIGYEVELPMTDSSQKIISSTKNSSLWAMLGLAFLGGLILNIMPCVLPVIALKILGFVQQSEESPQKVRQLGLIYALGVLASFVVLALLVIGVQKAGHAASWGMQFQNPQFLVVMT
ncbi:MAG: protein-disulfide reductase DsbD domain-containing protein, partial [Limisphaerales bacterium]